jgi:tripartite-type tricarboxylate transporter receptor subunit TctC
MMAHVSLIAVPYRGSAPALRGLVTGDADVMFDNLGVSLALMKSGQLKLIAVCRDRRIAALPDVPTIAETLPGFASSAWYAIVAPPRTPQWIADLSAESVGSDPPASAQIMREEVKRWNAVIKATNVKLE